MTAQISPNSRCFELSAFTFELSAQYERNARSARTLYIRRSIGYTSNGDTEKNNYSDTKKIVRQFNNEVQHLGTSEIVQSIEGLDSGLS